jgi:MFS family permease
LALWVLVAKGCIVERAQDLEPLPDPSRADIKRAFIVLAFTMSGTTIIFTAFTTLLPKWMDLELSAALGGNLTALGAIITLAYLLGASSQLLGGHMADKGAAKIAYILSYALKSAALAAACVLSGWSLLFIAIAVIFAFDIAAPIESMLIARYSPSRRRGLAYGFRNGLAVVGAPLGVQLVARFYNPAEGFIWVLLILAAIAVTVMAVAFALPEDRQKSGSAELA